MTLTLAPETDSVTTTDPALSLILGANGPAGAVLGHSTLSPLASDYDDDDEQEYFYDDDEDEDDDLDDDFDDEDDEGRSDDDEEDDDL